MTIRKNSNVHTIRLRFDDTPEDQALYAALRASSEREHRNPLPRHIRYVLAMAMGLIDPDLFLLKRLGFSDVDDYDLVPQAAATVAQKIISAAQAAETMRLIPGGADARTSDDN